MGRSIIKPNFNIMITQPSDTAKDMIANTRPPSFGEKLVGLSFNPSNDNKVDRAKKICAELADLLYEDQRNSETPELENILLPATYAAILNAQMNVVKVLTWISEQHSQQSKTLHYRRSQMKIKKA